MKVHFNNNFPSLALNNMADGVIDVLKFQKGRIAWIAVAIFSCIALIYTAYHYCNFSKKTEEAKLKSEDAMESKNKAEVVRSPNQLIVEKQVGDTKIVLLTGSIVDETADVIVNAANTNLVAGAGVCGIIRNAAGPDVFTECKEILEKQERPSINCGEAVLTSAGELSSKIRGIVHTAGPDCRDIGENENRAELLTQVYMRSLELLIEPEKNLEWISPFYKQENATLEGLHSIAFPSISTGIFCYPLEEAVPLAIKTIKDFVAKHPGKVKEVRFVCLPADKDPLTVAAYQKVLESFGK